MPLLRLSDSELFRADSLSWIMAGLILFVVAHVTSYSRRYLAGDRNFRRQRRDVLLLAAGVLVMVFADHLLVFLAGWITSNLLLVTLMIHKSQWNAARNAGLLAFRTFGMGFFFLAGGFWLLAESADTASIHGITTVTDRPPMVFIGLVLVALAAMIQSASWPFHRWLMSSLNSPTPVSALMHAGLVNGGGFLLVRFAPLYLAQPTLLHGLFVAGLITAVVGTFWKLLQPNVKRMLACSTMGQMGFMLMQCGMGLFAPAVSHLCWHGVFKAYLFLNTGSVVQEKRRTVSAGPTTPLRLALTCVAGAMGSVAFTMVSGIGFNMTDTRCVMIGLAFMTAFQLASGSLQKPFNGFSLIAVPFLGMGAGALYGLSIRLVETAIGSIEGTHPQPIDAVYVAGLAVIVLVWIAMNLNVAVRLQSVTAWKRFYIAALNGSQPHPQTVTATRTSYQY